MEREKRRGVLLVHLAVLVLCVPGVVAQRYPSRNRHKPSVPFWSHPAFDPEIEPTAVPAQESAASSFDHGSLLETFNKGLRIHQQGFAAERKVAQEEALKRQQGVPSDSGGAGGASGMPSFQFRELHRRSRRGHRDFRGGAPPPDLSAYSARARFRERGANSLSAPPSAARAHNQGLSYGAKEEEMPFRRYARQLNRRRGRRRYEGSTTSTQAAAPSFAEMQERVVRAALAAKRHPSRQMMEGPFGGALDYGADDGRSAPGPGRIAVPTPQRVLGATGQFEAPEFTEVFEQINSIVKNPHPDPSIADHHNPIFAHQRVQAPSRAPPPPPPPPPGPVMFASPAAAPLPTRAPSLIQETSKVTKHGVKKMAAKAKATHAKPAAHPDPRKATHAAKSYIEQLASARHTPQSAQHGGNKPTPPAAAPALIATNAKSNAAQPALSALPTNAVNSAQPSALLQQLSTLVSQLQRVSQPQPQPQPQPLLQLAQPVPSYSGLQPGELLELRSLLHAVKTGGAAQLGTMPVFQQTNNNFAQSSAASQQQDQLHQLLGQLQTVLTQRTTQQSQPTANEPRFRQVVPQNTALPPIAMPSDQSAALVPLRNLHAR